MIKTNNKKGFTLAELAVGIVLTAIVALTVASTGSIAAKSYLSMRNNIDVYNDSQFALQLIREAVRQTTQTPTIDTATNCLTIVTPASTQYFYTLPAVTPTMLVYGSGSGSGCGVSTNTYYKNIISNVSNLVFNPSVSGQLVTVALSGTKNNNIFNYLISATGRISWESS